MHKLILRYGQTDILCVDELSFVHGLYVKTYREITKGTKNTLFKYIDKYTSKQLYFCLEHTSVRRFMDPFSSIQKTNVKILFHVDGWGARFQGRDIYLFWTFFIIGILVHRPRKFHLPITCGPHRKQWFPKGFPSVFSKRARYWK